MRLFALFVRLLCAFLACSLLSMLRQIEVKMAPSWAAAWRARRSLRLRNIALTAASRLPSCWTSSQRSCVKTSATWRFCAGAMHLPTKLASRLRQRHKLPDTVGRVVCFLVVMTSGFSISTISTISRYQAMVSYLHNSFDPTISGFKPCHGFQMFHLRRWAPSHYAKHCSAMRLCCVACCRPMPCAGSNRG